MTSFCDHAWQRVTELRAAIHNLPFNRELAAFAKVAVGS